MVICLDRNRRHYYSLDAKVPRQEDRLMILFARPRLKDDRVLRATKFLNCGFIIYKCDNDLSSLCSGLLPHED